MKTRRFLWLALIAAVMLPLSSKAVLTNIWPFTTPSQYSLSNSNDIEVADGVAKLKLISVERHDASLATYSTNGTASANLGIGPDISVTLKKSGSLYATRGQFTSRIIDGGSGNLWQMIHAWAYNVGLANAGFELAGAESGVVGLWHMNNNWADSSSRSNNGTSLGASFTANSVQGSHAGNFSSADMEAGGVPASSVMTIAFWAYSFAAESSDMYVPLCFVVGSGPHIMVRLGGTQEDTGSRNRAISLKNWAGGGASTASGTWNNSDINRWQHIAITYNNGTIKIFKNGAALPLVYNNWSGSFPSHSKLRFGSYVGSYRFGGYLDECVIYSRALSDDEVYKLYLRPRSLLFQVRSGASRDEVALQSFVGPEGSNSFYTANFESLQTSDGFRIWDQFVQYKAIFYGPASGSDTPYLDAAGLTGTRVTVFDNTLGDFQTGDLSQNVTNYPLVFDAPYLGLAKNENGGYSTNGTYTSKILDAGTPSFWFSLAWTIPPELGTGINSLLALWHLNGGWADGTGNGYNGTPVNVDWDNRAKLGSQACVFDGSTSYVQIPGLAAKTVKSLEFWVRDDNVQDAILQLTSNATVQTCLVISNRLVTPIGFGAYLPTLYVNGSTVSRQLNNGWNHVVITLPNGILPASFIIGYALGDYMGGVLDEMAAYSRVLSAAEIKGNFVAGRVLSAGVAKFKVRAGDALPLTGDFVGPEELNPNSYITDSTGGGGSGNLPGSVINKRYFQYRAYFEGDGVVTPTVGSIAVKIFGQTPFEDKSIEDFATGTFDGGLTKWVGDEIKLPDMSAVPGLVNMNPVGQSGLEGLWHMEEETWPAGPTIVDSSSGGRNGQPQNGAAPSSVTPRVGLKSGSFDGVNDYAILPGILFAGDFSIGLWFRSTGTARSALISRSDGRYLLEFNSDGNAVSPGQVAFVLNNGVIRKVAAGIAGGLNDGTWHHVEGVRRANEIILYIDGSPCGGAFLGESFGSLGSGEGHLARHAVLGTYFGGGIDEVVIFGRALSEGEVRHNIAAGFNAKDTGTYESQIYDAERPAIWESIAWREGSPYGQPLSPTDTAIAALWHMNDTSGVVVVDASPDGHDGTVVGTVNRTTGRFGGALALDGSTWVEIPDEALLEPPALSVEAWVNFSKVDARTVFDKRSATAGYALTTDTEGRPVFWVSGSPCQGVGGIQSGRWYHLAGTYDGLVARLYVDGALVGMSAITNGATDAGIARIGRSYDGSGNGLDGVVDEVAVWTKALNSEVIADHSRAGFGRLQVQARSGDTPDLAGMGFVGPGGLTNTFFENAAGEFMVGSVALGRYFQYRAYLSTDDGLQAPRFQGASVKQSGYPTDNPWVMPADSYGLSFLGKLTDFAHVMSNNTDTSVLFQVSWY
jgi:hypothetical protein